MRFTVNPPDISLGDAPRTVPGPPTDLAAVEAPAGTLTATWDPPATDGGYPVTGYVATIQETGQSIQTGPTTTEADFDIVVGLPRLVI